MNTQSWNIYDVLVMTIFRELFITKVCCPDPKCLELAQTLHPWAGSLAWPSVGNLQRELGALETPTFYQKIINSY